MLSSAYSRSTCVVLLTALALASTGCCGKKTDKPVVNTQVTGGQYVTATYDATPKVTRTTSITEQVDTLEPPPPIHVTTVRTITHTEQYDGHGHKVKLATNLHEAQPTVMLGTTRSVEQQCPGEEHSQIPVTDGPGALVDPATDPQYVPDFQAGKTQPKK